VVQFIGENNTLDGKVTGMDGANATVQIDGGPVVQALAVNCGAAGNKTMLSVRPERILIGDASAPNAMEARVVELIYLGDHIRCRMEVAGNDTFIVKVPNSHAHAALNVGEVTPIGWVTEDCRALDAV
jgi:putative spermidine/putrescine transport system ATP-binding protein